MFRARAEGPGRGRPRGGGLVRWVRAVEALHTVAFCIVVWATVVAPAVHLSNHRGDHVHTAEGIRRRAGNVAGDVGHDHGDGRRHAHGDRDEDRPAENREPAPDHGRGAGEHFAQVALDAPAFLTPSPTLVWRRLPVAPPIAHPPFPSREPGRARGPPP